MPEIDLRNNYLAYNGYPIDTVFFEENIYKLITIFGASEFLYNNFKNDNKNFFDRAKKFEESKVSEILISLAIMSRSFLDSGSVNIDTNKDDHVGYIIIQEKEKKLSFRETCNKIIHAKNINFDVNKSESVQGGFLSPIVYLYGEHQDDKWRAVINIVDFCKEAINCF